MRLLTSTTFVSALLMMTACPAEENEPEVAGTDAAETDGDPDPDDTDTDADPDPDPDPDPDETDTDAEPEPADCSCYDDALEPPDELYCPDPEDIVPGCEPPAPACDTIEAQLDELGEDVLTVSNPEAVDCLLEQLAAGELPTFTISTSTTLGGDTDIFWPVDGTYIHIACSLYDNPPESLNVVRLEPEDFTWFETCEDLECLLQGLPHSKSDPIDLCD